MLIGVNIVPWDVTPSRCFYLSVVRKHSTWRRAHVATAVVQMDAMSQGFSDERCLESVPFDLKYLGAGVSGKLHHDARKDYFQCRIYV
jgi:hypothetical protein